MGRSQIAWLPDGLKKSKAVWKVIANGDDGMPLGREIEISRLLREIKHARIQNVVWLTADVHYTAPHQWHAVLWPG